MSSFLLLTNIFVYHVPTRWYPATIVTGHHAIVIASTMSSKIARWTAMKEMTTMSIKKAFLHENDRCEATWMVRFEANEYFPEVISWDNQTWDASWSEEEDDEMPYYLRDNPVAFEPDAGDVSRVQSTGEKW
jgi:hypothetical protein